MKAFVFTLLLAGGLLAVVSADKEFDVQHSLDGGKTFVPAGTIQQQLDGSTLELVRSSAPAPGDLTSLVEQDGFYVIRVPTGRPGRFASASVRATCLAASPQAEKLNLALDDFGSVLSVSYALEGLPTGPCKASGTPALPPRSFVTLQQPESGPTVLPPQLAQEVLQSPMFSSGGDGSAPGQAGGGGPTNRPRGVRPSAVQGGAEGDAVAEGQAAEGGPVPEEKTWLQKNWLVVAGVSMAVMNLLGNLAKQAQQPPAAAAGAAVGRAAPRR